MMADPRVVVDDPTFFPNVARIPNVMLRHYDPKNPVIVLYLASIDFSNSRHPDGFI